MYQVELKSGETYRGELAEAEDSWNVQLKNVTATAKVSRDIPSMNRDRHDSSSPVNDACIVLISIQTDIGGDTGCCLRRMGE